MPSDLFSLLLEELSKALQLPGTLQPDSLNSCVIVFKNEVEVQCEMDPNDKFFMMRAIIEELLPGRYREGILKQALIANNLPDSKGVFAFQKASNRLVLCRLMSLQHISGDKIAEELQPLVEKAGIWKNAILKGELPPLESASSSSASGMFGLAR